MIRTALVAGLVFGATFVSGCSSTLKAGQLNTAGRFDASASVAPENLKIERPFDKSRFGAKVVVLPFTENNSVNEFYYTSIKNAGKFETVLDKTGVEKLVIQKNLTGVSDASSILSLRNLSTTEGTFLVIKPYFEWKGGYDYTASLDAIDITDGNVVFHAEKKAFNFAGLDKTLFYPIFNSFMDWVDGVPPPPVISKP